MRINRGAAGAIASLLTLVSAGGLAGPSERRTVTYREGPCPILEIDGPAEVKGALELVIVFQDTNSLCYDYSQEVAIAEYKAPQPLPTLRDVLKSVPLAFENVDFERRAQDASDLVIRLRTLR